MAENMNWISVKDRLPSEPGLYTVHSPSGDPEKPMICQAWYEPEGTGNQPGWQLMLEPFIPGITHWMKVTPPESKGAFDGAN